MDSRGLAGIAQGPSGVTQGAQGVMEAAKNGPKNAAMSSAGERKPMGLFSFLAPLAGIASAIPGPWQPFAAGASALLGGISSHNAQNQAAGAAGAAQGAQSGALAGETGIANRLASAPDYGGTLQAESQGINTLQRNMGGIANPGALIKDLQGQNIQNAIRGDNEGQSQRLGYASSILSGTGQAYNNIGTQAGAAANAQGNPFGGLMQSIPGMIGGGPGPSAGLLGGLQTPNATDLPSQLPGAVPPVGMNGTLAPPIPANPFARK